MDGVIENKQLAILFRRLSPTLDRQWLLFGGDAVPDLRGDQRVARHAQCESRGFVVAVM